MEVISDRIGGRYINGRAGRELERRYLVKDVTGQASAKLLTAAEASGVPRRGDRHPHDATLICRDVEAQPAQNDPGIIEVIARYADESGGAGAGAGTAGGAVEFFADLFTEETTEDVNGRKLVTSYTGHLPELVRNTLEGQETASPSVEITLQSRRHRVQVERPTVGLRVTRREAVVPRALIFGATAHVNESPWNGFPSRTWLCRGIDTRPAEDGHEVSYTFSYNVKTWQAILHTRIGPDIPENITEGNGIGRFDVYALFDFNRFGVRF